MNNNTRFYNSENGRRVDEGFEFSGMSDVDYTDTFADIDQKEETESAVKIAAGKDLVFELGDEIGLIFTTFDDNGDPLGFDGSGNLIVRLDIDMKLARPGQSAPPPSELAFRIDLSRGGFTEFTKKFGS